MAIQKRIASKIPIACLGIMILFLITGIDEISGVWQPWDMSVPIIQSGSNQDDSEDDCKTSFYKHAKWREAIDDAKQLQFSRANYEEIKLQVTISYLDSSRDRAPPSFF